MPLQLTVDGERWRAHLRALADAQPGLVPVAKGNGYGFGLGRLARKAGWLGVEAVAVDQLPHLAAEALRAAVQAVRSVVGDEVDRAAVERERRAGDAVGVAADRRTQVRVPVVVEVVRPGGQVQVDAGPVELDARQRRTDVDQPDPEPARPDRQLHRAVRGQACAGLGPSDSSSNATSST